MAIDRIPGVGPQNSDIAAAVNAPSAATIASTVASSVPTLAQINTAVNTQTNNSAIATAVAGAVPTLAQITSTVQANAGSPFGGTWTNIDTRTSFPGTITYSNLGGYRYLRMYFGTNSFTGGQDRLSLRFNGDAGFNYFIYGAAITGTTTVGFGGPYQSQMAVLSDNNNANSICIEIDGSNSNVSKIVKVSGLMNNTHIAPVSFGIWNNTSPITSVQIFQNGSTTNVNGIFNIVGAV